MRWLADRHGWQVEREWLTYIPGIVKGIGMAINVFVKEDEKVHHPAAGLPSLPPYPPKATAVRW